MSERSETKRPYLRDRWVRFTGPRRLAGIDLARGLAVIGMFAAHLLAIPPFDWTDAATWTDVVNGRSSILFATLAGVSIGLVTGRTDPFRGERMGLARRRLAVRALMLWLIGLALIALGTPVYVILPAYAVLFILVLPALGLTSGWLFALAAALAVTMPFVQYGIWQLPIWQSAAGDVVSLVTGDHYPPLVWSAFVIAGLAIGRLRIPRPLVSAALLAGGSALAAIGYGVSAATAGLRDGGGLLAFVTDASAHSSGAAEVIGSGGFAIAVIGLCLLIAATPLAWIVLPLRAVGAMALTAYAGQLIAWALLQPVPAPGESTLSAFRATEPFLPFTIWTIVLCTAWTLLVGRGPLEWLVDRTARFVVRR